MPATPTTLELRAPAKINLHLRVGSRRADGFHPLSTWMCTVGLFDTLTFRPHEGPGHHDDHGDDDDRGGPDAGRAAPPASLGGGPGAARTATRTRPPLTLATDDSRLPTGATNLVVRAAAALAEAVEVATAATDRGRGDTPGGAGEGSLGPRAASAVAVDDAAGARNSLTTRESRTPLRAVEAFLAKRVPSGAGLGGGSSDAASTLIALDRLWQLGWTRERLAAVAGAIGSDVPFFLFAPSAACAGRGEVVQPIGAPTVARWAVLVLPAIEMPTPAVYRRFDELGLGDAALATADPEAAADAAASEWSGSAGLPARDLLAMLANDLEPAAFAIRPDLGELRAAIEGSLGRPVRMSGSGSSLFTLFDAEPEAAEAANEIAQVYGVRALRVELAPPAG